MSAFVPARRDDFAALPVEVAPTLLGGMLRVRADGVEVAVRITEVEAYHGLGTGAVHDPGSHARSGPTARNRTMWAEPGRLYVYLSHGIHSCLNVVAAPEGVAGAILLRGGEVVEGAEAAHRRRPAARSPRELARGPGRFADAVGLRHPQHDGLDLITGEAQAAASARLFLLRTPVGAVASGPRVGVAGAAGTAAFPWRFWLEGEPTVSAFRWGRGAGPTA